MQHLISCHKVSNARMEPKHGHFTRDGSLVMTFAKVAVFPSDGLSKQLMQLLRGARSIEFAIKADPLEPPLFVLQVIVRFHKPLSPWVWRVPALLVAACILFKTFGHF